MAIENRQDSQIRISAVDLTQQAFRSVTTGLSKLDSSVAAVGLRFGALGAGLGVASLGLFGTASINAVAALDDLSESTGLTVEFLSQLERVAIVGGHSLDSVAGSASKFAKNIGEAKTGNTEIAKTFEAFGISIDDLKSRNLDSLFLEVATKVATAEDNTTALALATKLLGRSAAEQLPFLKDLAEQGLGAVRVTTEQAAAAEKLQKEFGKMKVSATDLGVSIGNFLVPALTNLVQTFNDARKAGGLFEGVMAALGGGVTQTSERLQAIGKELDELRQKEKEAGSAISFSPLVTAAKQGARAIRQARIKELEAEQRGLNAILAARQRDVPELTEPPKAIDASGLDDTAKKAAEALAKLEEQRAKREIDDAKQLASDRLRILEVFYNDGLVAETTYWDTREAIQSEALAKQVQATALEIKLREEAVGKTKPGTAERHKAVSELEDAQERLNKSQEEFSRFVVDNNLSAAKSTREYADAVRELDAQLADIEGRTGDAIAIRQEARNRTLRARLSNDPDAASKLKAVEAGQVAQARFNDTREKGTDITARLALEEERIQNTLRTGSISELEAMRRTSAARQEAARSLNSVADALDKAGKDSGIKNLQLQAEQFRVEVEKLEGSSDLLKERFDQIGETALGDFLAEAVEDIDNVGKAFERLAKTILTETNRLASQEISKKILGAVGFEGAGGFGSIMSKIFGGGGGGAPATAGTSITDLFGLAFAADGAHASSGDPFIVGEKGPELFVPKTGGMIMPNGSFGGRGSSTVINNFYVQGNIDNRTQQQMAKQAGRSIDYSMDRNN